MNLGDIKKLLSHKKAYLTQKYHISELGIFGSYVQGEQNIESDIDILVSFEKGHRDFFNYIRLKYFLDDLIGTEVDLVLKDAIRPRLKQSILNEVEYV